VSVNGDPVGTPPLLAFTPGVTLLADAGYQRLSAQTAGAMITPRPTRRKNQRPARPPSPRSGLRAELL
jgi:hypothetical protein